MACNPQDLREIDDLPNNKPKEVFASQVVQYSSQYNTQGWSANQILGPPRVFPRYGDIQGSWAQGMCDAAQFITIEFPKALYIDRLDIYETMNGGAITAIKVKTPQNSMHTVFQQVASVVTTARIFSPDIDIPNYPVRVIRLELDCTVAGTWCEIDAVKLVGREINTETPPPMKNLAYQLYPLVNSRDFSDIQFSLGKRTLYAHRAILAARSDYFRAMLGSGMKESQDDKPINIEGVSPGAFLGLLQYFYTNTLAKDTGPENMLELMRVADRFSAEGLSVLCFWFLRNELNIDNVISLYRSAAEDVPALDNVRDLCLDFMTSHMEEISHRKDFSQLTQQQMLEVVQLAATKIRI